MADIERDGKALLETVLKQDADGLSALTVSAYDIDLPVSLRRYDKNVTAIEVAASRGYIECIRKLLELGINLIYLNTLYKRALLLAVLGGHWECVCLLSRRALFEDVLPKDCQGLDMFILSTERCDFSQVQHLIGLNVGKDWLSRAEGVSLINLLIFYNCPVSILQSLVVGTGGQMNGHDHHGFTPLMAAVIVGNMELTEFLLKNGADKNLCDKKEKSNLPINCNDERFKENSKWDIVYGEFKTALMFAVIAKKYECVDLLLKSGVDVNLADEGGFTALMHAAYTGNSRCVGQLIGSGHHTDVNMIDKKKRSALIHAAYSGVVACVQSLLQSKADQSHKDCWKRTALLAAVISNNTDCSARLLSCQDDIDAEDSKRKSTVMYAAESGNVEMLDMLVQKMETPPASKQKDRVTSLMKSALFSAVKANARECVELLVKNKCNVNCKDVDEETPLMHACGSGKTECFDLLVKHGADLKAVVKSKKNSMIMYAVSGDLKCLEFLIKKGAKVNAANGEGETALMMACAAGREDCCQLLLKHGAKFNAVNKIKQTAMMYAVKKGKLSCFQLLLDKGADIDIADIYEHSILYYTFSNNECCKALLSKSKQFLSKPVHMTSFSHTEPKSVPIPVIITLMQNKMLHWKGLSQDPIRLFFAAVLGGMPPAELSTMFTDKVFSLPRAFFGGDANVVRYLLANLYFTVEDYKTVKSDVDFLRCVRQGGDRDMVTVLDQITSKPCSLQSLCLVNISTYISASSSNLTRAEKVECLPMGNGFKTRLMFQGSMSRLCPVDWGLIGKLNNCFEEQDLSSLTRGDFVPCGKKMCTCSGEGLAFQPVKLENV